MTQNVVKNQNERHCSKIRYFYDTIFSIQRNESFLGHIIRSMFA